jgi:UDPglucose 6-dehydrogenase
MRVTVFGLWHLGCVTAACLAEAGHRVAGLDFDKSLVSDLQNGSPPISEPGLPELLRQGAEQGLLSFNTDAREALQDAEVLWITFDTPVNEDDQADIAWLRRQLEAAGPHLRPGTLVLVSSQVPVGFTADLQRHWAGRGLRFAVSPENLRLGKALECFRNPGRIVAGCDDEQARGVLNALLKPFCTNIVWMSIASAEMTKHAINAFLATSVTFINELSRICESTGASAKEVERGLKSEERIGPKAYLSPGAAFAGGTLARDLRFLIELSQQGRIQAPLFQGVLASNDVHKEWVREKVAALLLGKSRPVAAILGLTYKPGTDTLRRSSALELCRWLHERHVAVQGHDPAVRALPVDLDKMVKLCDSPAAALKGADVAVIATEWPAFKGLPAELFVSKMRCPQVIDQNHFLAGALGGDSRIRYQATGI